MSWRSPSNRITSGLQILVYYLTSHFQAVVQHVVDVLDFFASNGITCLIGVGKCRSYVLRVNISASFERHSSTDLLLLMLTLMRLYR